jgi:transposase-like protein
MLIEPVWFLKDVPPEPCCSHSLITINIHKFVALRFLCKRCGVTFFCEISSSVEILIEIANDKF